MASILCFVPEINADLAIECVEEFLAEDAEIETFVAWMMESGYDMTIFGDAF